MGNATRIKQGKFQVVEVTYNAKGKSIVTPISKWMPIPNEFWLHGYPTSAQLVKGTKYEGMNFVG